MMLMTRLGAIASQYVTPPLLADYLVIAGGGGGGSNGGSGGGAGGYLEGTALTLSVDTSYAVTVGIGGARADRTVGTRTSGVKGGNSSFVGGAVNIVSIGGGYGQVGGWDQDSPGSGGSGGGASMYTTVGTPTGANGTTGQGHKGGNATNTGNYYQSAGGGGAGSVGGNASGTTNSIGGIGGSGLSSDITGSPVVRASGGNGYGQDAVIAGGGGAGDGEPNTGSGGGFRGAGGSGVVILKFPIGYIITVSGLTYSSVILGEFKIYTFTGGTGTVTFRG